VQAEMLNAVGISVYKAKLYFTAGKADIRLGNVSPGTYLLKLNDSKGRHFTLKFTIL
jgi:hypothetical protein